MQMARNEPSCSGAEFKVPDTGEGKTIKLSLMSDSFDWCIWGNLVGNVDSIRFSTTTRQSTLHYASKERHGIHLL